MSDPNALAASLQQVENLKRTEENEISNLTDNFESLKLAQSKFMESSISLQGLGRIADDRDIMVPMTSSLYVPGKLVAGSQVLVDVGTNFIVGKSIKDADEIFQRKIQYVKQSSEQILKMINKKKESLGELEAMADNLKRQLARYEAAAAAGGAASS